MGSGTNFSKPLPVMETLYNLRAPWHCRHGIAAVADRGLVDSSLARSRNFHAFSLLILASEVLVGLPKLRQ